LYSARVVTFDKPHVALSPWYTSYVFFDFLPYLKFRKQEGALNIKQKYIKFRWITGGIQPEHVQGFKYKNNIRPDSGGRNKYFILIDLIFYRRISF